MCEIVPPSGGLGKSLSDWYELQELVEEHGSDLVHNNITKLVKCLHTPEIATFRHTCSFYFSQISPN